MPSLPLIRWFAAVAASSLTALAAGAGDDTIVYKETAGRPLHLFIDKPADWKAGAKRPAIVFFFGGGWVGGTPNQFKPQSEHFAARGAVGIRVEYRVIPKGDPGPPLVCIQDAKSAMRYVRGHASELGIDPARIAAAGGSAGGHLAAATALLPGLDDPKDDLAVSPRPDALILFNPVFDNGPGQWGNGRVGNRYKEFSPAHHVDAKAPPTIVFLGEEDKLIPVQTVRNFADAMKKSGARCEALFYPGVGHGFFNKGANGGREFKATLAAADSFLVTLGWLSKIEPPGAAAP
jgi:acetyl esterase/lipase